jgi:molybdopterin-guanine dinucleotide biosynthesis protein A
MDAIIIAGGITQPGEPLYLFTQGKPKAMLDICGKPMVQWILDALDQAQSIDRVVIAGMGPDEKISGTKLQSCIPDQGSMIANIRAGVLKVLELNPGAEHVVVASSDIPAIMPEQIDWVVQTALKTNVDVYYNVITREAMEKKYPASKRSYVHLKDMDVCGGDLNILRASIVNQNDALWEKIIDARKNALKQAALIGYDTLILLLLRQITLAGAIKKVTKRIGLTGQALVCPYAEVGMDVDKPHQLEIIREDLSRRAQSG